LEDQTESMSDQAMGQDSQEQPGWWSKKYKGHLRTRHTGQNIHPGIIIHTQLDYFGHRHTPFIHIVVRGSGFQRGTTVATNNIMPSEQERQIAELVGRSWVSKRSKRERERAEASIRLCRARAFWRPWSRISLLRSRSQVIARSNSAGRLVTGVELSRSSPVIGLREVLCLTNNGFWLLSHEHTAVEAKHNYLLLQQRRWHLQHTTRTGTSLDRQHHNLEEETDQDQVVRSRTAWCYYRAFTVDARSLRTVMLRI
jgi:hypothetical protein